MPTEPAAGEVRIMIVDDVPENLQILETMLLERGYQVFAFPNGELALKAAAKQPPDLILLDINMPKLNGYEVCGRLKADPALRDIPVVFLSGLNETNNKIKAFEVGGVDYVTKPFNVAEVEARIRTQLTLSRLRQDVEARNRKLEANYRQLRELEALRDNLVHMIVHDLRAPVMGISLAAGLLEEANTDVERTELVRGITAAAAGIQHMIANLLDISKMESGAMPVNRTGCDLDALVRRTIDEFQYILEDRTLAVHWQPGGCPTVSADESMIQRVIANLLGNAARFSPEGETIQITCHRDADGAVRISVSDRGPGIPMAFQEKIFEKFGQLEARKSRQLPTTGLGLAFCKLAVEAHGGDIGVFSEPGNGATLWFTIPEEAPRCVAEG